MNCGQCGQLIPEPVTARRRYCGESCRMRARKRRPWVPDPVKAAVLARQAQRKRYIAMCRATAWEHY
jgi:hypothetical protein